MRYVLADNPSRPDADAERNDPRVLATAVAAVTVGIVAVVALLQYQFIHLETQASTGLVQGLVVGVYKAIGFVPTLYLGALIAGLGGLTFVSGHVAHPLRRIWAALLLAVCLSFLLGAFGSGGGELGSRAAGRLMGAVGSVPIVLLLGTMTIVAVLLATNWFCLPRVLRQPASSAPADTGLGPVEEQLLREPAPAPVVPSEESLAVARQERLGLVPRPASASVDHRGDERRREQELMDRALAETRRDFDVGRVDQPAAPVKVHEEEIVDNGLAELDDEELLFQAGDDLDRALNEDSEVPFLIVPSPELDAVRAADAADVDASDDLEDDFDEESAGEPEDTGNDPWADPAPRVERYSIPDTTTPMQEQLFAESTVDDDLLDRAVRVLLTARRPSPALLQRKLGLGYGQAREVLDQLVELDVLYGPDEGGHWEALIELAEWEAR